MKYLSVSETAAKWGLSERSVRNYCAAGRISGAFLTGKTWNIPENAQKPPRKKKDAGSPVTDNLLLNVLREEMKIGLKGGIYHKVQIAFAYNSNRIEGSTLSEDQTRFIFETNTIASLEPDETFNADDIIETGNHFRCVDFVIENADKPLTEEFIKELHFILKSGTSDSRKSWFNVGEYKSKPNVVGGNETSLPENTASDMKKLLDKYNSLTTKRFEDIVSFHYLFERIHPFQDGNGRVGRLIIFKECLANNIIPFIIEDRIKLYYYRGLKEWNLQKGYLLDTCLSAQDKFIKIMDYFRIEH